MAVSDERKRVLDMLASGKISVDDATSLLKALGPTPAEAFGATAAPSMAGDRDLPPPPPTPPAAPLRPRRTGTRVLRITVDEVSAGHVSNKVKVNVPLGLAKFALRFMPAKAKEELALQNIDLSQVLDGITEEAPDGNIVNVEAEKKDGSGVIERVTIEVI